MVMSLTGEWGCVELVGGGGPGWFAGRRGDVFGEGWLKSMNGCKWRRKIG